MCFFSGSFLQIFQMFEIPSLSENMGIGRKPYSVVLVAKDVLSGLRMLREVHVTFGGSEALAHAKQVQSLSSI
jgi:hypothetical protein